MLPPPWALTLPSWLQGLGDRASHTQIVGRKLVLFYEIFHVCVCLQIVIKMNFLPRVAKIVTATVLDNGAVHFIIKK